MITQALFYCGREQRSSKYVARKSGESFDTEMMTYCCHGVVVVVVGRKTTLAQTVADIVTADVMSSF